MTPKQIELVQSSFEKVRPIAQEAARLFYAQLFQLDPALRPMFRGDMEEQGRKLMQIMGVAVGSLKRLEQILPAVEDLGRRHAVYGVREEHYTTVGSALLWSLKQGLGDEFTAEVEAAWAVMYSLITAAMQNSAATRAA